MNFPLTTQKFFAVVRHEYKKVVLRWSFLIGTLLLPLLAAAFAIVPAVIFSIKGDSTRITVADPSGKISSRLMNNLSSDVLSRRAEEAIQDIDVGETQRMPSGAMNESFNFVPPPEVPAGELRNALRDAIVEGEIDAYLIIPENFSDPEAVFEFRSKNAGDFITNETFRDALNDAVRSQRFAEADISDSQLSRFEQPIRLESKGISETGEETDNAGVMAASFLIGLMIYITLTIYGQTILGAVVEEKETRIAEILFSSARPFELMMGKLVGVGLAGLTQLSIWVASAAAIIVAAANQGEFAEVLATVPRITPLMVIYFLIFFLLGFFIYASIFALIGSMVTTVQEGGQFAFPPIMILLIGFYLSFAVIRDPDSTLSFWVSIAPFFAPITMPVRILAQTPPFWQIAAAVAVNVLAIAGLVWVTSKVYRVGMLMYGKRATIPEVWKWIRQP